MATAGEHTNLLSTVPPPVRSSAFTRLSGKPYELHEAVFRGDQETVDVLLREASDVCNVVDCHGNTPLHLAAMLGHEKILQLLLERKASARSKNSLGWTPLNEAVSYGNRTMILSLVKRLHEEIKDGLLERRVLLLQSLRNLEDFSAELKWEFHTWVPFLSRLLPNDICTIYKTGSSIRLDSTIGDFVEMQWTRGNISFIYNGENTEGLSVVALDHNKKKYQRMSLNSEESMDVSLDDNVDSIMTRPIVYANMSTQPITVTRAQSGYFFFNRTDRTETVGEYSADVYNIMDLILVSRKRREHLTPEQIQHYEELHKRVESGNITEDLKEMSENNENNEEDTKEHCPSLPPPPPHSLTWDQYLSSKDVPCLGRSMDLRIDRKTFKSTVYMSEQCPIEMKKLLDILEVIAPYKHFHKLRQFVNLKLPPGFPVKLEIPVFPTVTAIVTLQQYRRSQFPPSHFLIPREYTKYEPNESS